MACTISRTVLLVGTAWAAFTANPVLAQAEAESGVSGDIIVTARRTEERLQDVPISMTVFSKEQISRNNIVVATDLGAYTPSLSVNQRYGPEKSSFAIRGFVQENATAPSVGVYFADVTAPRAQGGTSSGNTVVTGSFMDLQNVQVLKGPQGTLFGRNTTGGAVLLVPTKPTDRLEGYVEASVGDYSMRRGQAAFNLPLADTFKVRLAVDRNKRDGYIRNRSGIGPKDYADVNYFAGRLSIVADLTPDLENYTIATYSNSFGHGYAARLVTCNPDLTSGAAALLAKPACDQIARQNARGDSLLDVDVDAKDAYVKLRHWQVINTTTWRASDTLTIKNIASYAEFRERSSFSLNGDNFTSNGRKFQYIVLATQPGGNNAAQSTFTEELQFQGQSGDGNLVWQAGGYLEIADPLGFSAGYTGILVNCENVEALACTNPLGAGSVQAPATKTAFNNKGIYAQATYDLTDKFSVTGGIRYTWDKVRSLAQNVRLGLQADGTFTRNCLDVVRYPSGRPGLGKAVTDSADCSVRLRQQSDKPTWLVGLDYKPTPDLLLYVKYARGYRQGGINPTNLGLETWGPEKVDTYELGAKSSFRGAVSGYFNLAGFYNDFSDQQLNVSAISNLAGYAGSQPVVNAGKSRIMGVEVDASALFFDSLRFDLGYTYLDTKLKSITVPPIPAGAPYSALVPSALVGAALTLSPKNRVSATATYTLPLPQDLGKVSIGATFVHTDKQVFTQATLPQYRNLPATDLLNLHVNWNNALGQPVDVAFFMTNVTNQIYNVAVGSAINATGFENLMFGPPRMWGFRLRYSFEE